MEDDGTEGGLLDSVETNLEQIGSDILGVVTLGTYGGDLVPGFQPIAQSAQQGASNIGSAISDGVSSILPSGTEVWAGAVVLIVVLVLVAYIAREVAG